MIVDILHGSVEVGAAPELFLRADSDRDQRTLRLLAERYKVVGSGIHPETERFDHVRIALTTREAPP